MDEKLKALLSQAEANGADETEMKKIIRDYLLGNQKKKKKKPHRIPLFWGWVHWAQARLQIWVENKAMHFFGLAYRTENR